MRLQYSIGNLVSFREENDPLNTKSLCYIPLMLMMPLLVKAGPVWNVGTPANAYSLPPTTKPTPYFGSVLVNFDSLPSCFSFPPSGCTNYSGTTFSNDVTITSADGRQFAILAE
jgi:hypothetical protein